MTPLEINFTPYDPTRDQFHTFQVQWWTFYDKAVSRTSHDMGQTCVDPEIFVRGGPTFFFSFLVDERRENPNATISRPSLAPPANRH